MRTRTGVLVGLGASLVVTASAIGAFAWAAPKDVEPTGFRAYLASDLGPQVLGVTPADLATSGPITSSSSRSGFLSAISGIPSQTVAATVLSEADALGRVDTLQLLRAMSSSVATDGSTSSNFYVAIVDDSGLLKAAEMSSGGFTLWYSPPVVELPADITVGSTWSGTGTVNDIATYEFEGVIEAAGTEDCIVTATTSKLLIEGSVNVDTGRTVTVLERIPPTRLINAMPPSTPTYAAPASLPFLSPSVLLTAAVSGDVLVMTNSSSEEVVAVTLAAPPVDPEDPAADPPDLSVLRVAWMQHPGGEVLGLSSDGQNSYVTTTMRSVMSFDRAGGLRWRSMTSDVAAGAPVVIGDLVIVATLDGTVVAFDRGTGAQRWSRTMSDAVVADPVSTASAIVVGDIAGRVSAFTTAGEEVWTTDVAAVTRPMTAFADGTVLVGDDAGALHLLGANGAEEWSGVLAGPIVGPAQRSGGSVLVPTKSALQGFDFVNGDELWRSDEWSDAHVWATSAGLAVTAGDRIGNLDARGPSSPAQVVVEPDGDVVTDMQLVEIAGRTSILTSGGGLVPWPGTS